MGCSLPLKSQPPSPTHPLLPAPPPDPVAVSFQVVHRDIKLENILIDGEGHMKLIDFGLCGYYVAGAPGLDLGAAAHLCLWNPPLRLAYCRGRSEPPALRPGRPRSYLCPEPSLCAPAGKRLRCHCGSPSYAAPEIVARKDYLGPPVDVWSLGVVLFAMLAGYLPFHAKDKKVGGAGRWVALERGWPLPASSSCVVHGGRGLAQRMERHSA